jgi:hypothetical protein
MGIDIFMYDPILGIDLMFIYEHMFTGIYYNSGLCVYMVIHGSA